MERITSYQVSIFQPIVILVVGAFVIMVMYYGFKPYASKAEASSSQYSLIVSGEYCLMFRKNRMSTPGGIVVTGSALHFQSNSLEELQKVGNILRKANPKLQGCFLVNKK